MESLKMEESKNIADLQEYINKTNLELELRYTLTLKMARLAREMLDKRYLDIDTLQNEFDITYATLKALRENERENHPYWQTNN